MNELHEELERIAADKVEIAVFRFIHNSFWMVNFKKTADGVKLEVNAKGTTLADALNDAIEKWQRVTGTIKEFKGALISHFPPNETPHMDFNDEIPF